MSGSHDRSLTTYRVDTGMCKPPSDGGEGREGQGTEEGRVLEHKGRSRQLPGRGREASGRLREEREAVWSRGLVLPAHRFLPFP